MVQTASAPQPEPETTVGDEIYYCLFGVYSSPDGKPPTTKGPWADELAVTTYEHYKQFFKARIAGDPIALMEPDQVERPHLEAFRSRVLRTPSTYQRKKRTEWTDETGRRRVAESWETVTRKPPGPRTAERYLDVIINVLRRCGNDCADDLAPLKKAPPKKAWLDRREKDAFLRHLANPTLQLAAEMMMHGMCIGEVCAAHRAQLADGCLRIETQLSEPGGRAQIRSELKRTRRYRTIPLQPELAAKLAGIDGRFVPMLPNNLRRDLRLALANGQWSRIHPHDLRRSGGKWMLDAGAKLSDVAAILGNDPKTLLAWYDTADQEGMARAIRAI